MGAFLQTEKIHQANFKSTSPYITDAARADGVYKSAAYPFCLPREHAAENLYAGIREPILAYFARERIKWHDGQDGLPSNHLCDSQVCCANFLFPFFDQPEALAALLRPLFPDLAEMLPIEDGQYVAFEWIGRENYLGEKMPRNGQRTRGANFTSADAAVLFRRRDGSKQIVLIEWKYTESYSPSWLKIAPSGTDRTKIYVPLYAAADCPLKKELIPGFDALFYEPFYQFLRQQFLAHEMEKARELGAGRVSLLHISPAHNTDFRKVTAPALRDLDPTATGVWRRLVQPEGRFLAMHTEDLFGSFPIDQHPVLRPWWEYLLARYRWIQQSA